MGLGTTGGITPPPPISQPPEKTMEGGPGGGVELGAKLGTPTLRRGKGRLHRRVVCRLLLEKKKK